jgi:enoyl-CoA hydratase/carnithine racemase
MNPSNLRLAKELMNKGSSMSLADALIMESDAYTAVLDSPEAKTAIRAFLNGKEKDKR